KRGGRVGREKDRQETTTAGERFLCPCRGRRFFWRIGDPRAALRRAARCFTLPVATIHRPRSGAE
ncbi:MAG: hypothetical protein JXB13_06470, partial [Phycisphaerae bacterium]|nr:hypothetical protein [Phycisphaerae bacterium]